MLIWYSACGRRTCQRIWQDYASYSCPHPIGKRIHAITNAIRQAIWQLRH